jgi:hypothetical protein
LRGVVWPASLKALDLGSNSIVSLDGVVFPSNLTRLRLSYNRIESAPPSPRYALYLLYWYKGVGALARHAALRLCRAGTQRTCFTGT